MAFLELKARKAGRNGQLMIGAKVFRESAAALICRTAYVAQIWTFDVAWFMCEKMMLELLLPCKFFGAMWALKRCAAVRGDVFG